MTDFSVSFDYRCPFAKNIHLHVIEALRAGAPYHVTFVPWTLSQGAREDEERDAWDNPRRDSELLSLAAGVSVRDQQPEHFLDAHEALFLARHVHGHRLNTLEEVTMVLAGVGVDVAAVAADVASRRPHQVIGECYRLFERWEAFGVPTFVVGNDAVFVRYMDAPSGDAHASRVLIDELVAMVTDRPSLNEFKHTQLSA